MKVGDLVRIKEIPGTKLASKRQPVWAKIVHVTLPEVILDDEGYRYCVVYALRDLDFGQQSNRSRRRVSLQRRCFDFPTDKQVPNWVWAEIAKHALLNEGDN